jgi:flagellar basal-body rod protein FlgB
MPSFGPEAMNALHTAMRFRMARESVIAGNIANSDTPGYRRRELNFEGELSKQTSRLERTNPRHLSAADVASNGRLEVGPRGTRPDGNAIDLDQELVEANRNASSFIDQANILARLSTLVRTAIGPA